MLSFSRLGGCRLAAAMVSVFALAGCETVAKQQLSEAMLPPILNPVTEVNMSLRTLPAPNRKVVVAVYNYADQTGQFKPTDNIQSLSKAVTQGATSVIIKALQDTGNGNWFTVVEREKLDNLLKERRIIAEMRKTYLGEEQINPQALPPLLFAGILLEGGIIGYDSNLQTGGIGARLLGIGGDVKYRLDTITVYLRAVSTKNGQVMSSVVTHKTIASIALQGGVFKFIAIDKILEGEAGFTKNEPEQLGVQQAIEKAVYAMVVEGAEQGLWAFTDKRFQTKAIEDYREQQFSSSDQAALHPDGAKVAVAATSDNAAGGVGIQKTGTTAIAAAQKPAQGKAITQTGALPAASGAAPGKSGRAASNKAAAQANARSAAPAPKQQSKAAAQTAAIATGSVSVQALADAQADAAPVQAKTGEQTAATPAVPVLAKADAQINVAQAVAPWKPVVLTETPPAEAVPASAEPAAGETMLGGFISMLTPFLGTSGTTASSESNAN